jgi:hypothetical protein
MNKKYWHLHYNCPTYSIHKQKAYTAIHHPLQLLFCTILLLQYTFYELRTSSSCNMKCVVPIIAITEQNSECQQTVVKHTNNVLRENSFSGF